MNLQSEHIGQLCRQLKLERVLAEYGTVAQDAVREKASFTDFLERVLKVESDEIVAAAQRNGVPVEYVVFPDEGHGFIKKENEIAGYSKVIAVLDKDLKGTITTPVP